ncbi:hypothetical protein [Rhodococcus pseudokoreensis]|uniref:hypothetical protein n=1 Tax=Rhodococcus pseudokoreensis TaxID=2811421 RepID=UPI001F126561|nr:hypothetical protein [Rhodococcus pseudokoreensis]
MIAGALSETFILDGVLTGTPLPLDNSSSLSPPPTGSDGTPSCPWSSTFSNPSVRDRCPREVLLAHGAGRIDHDRMTAELVARESTFGHVAADIEALRRPGGLLDKDGPRASIHLFDPVARRRTRDAVVDAYLADQTEASAVSSRRWG